MERSARAPSSRPAVGRDARARRPARSAARRQARVALARDRDEIPSGPRRPMGDPDVVRSSVVRSVLHRGLEDPRRGDDERARQLAVDSSDRRRVETCRAGRPRGIRARRAPGAPERARRQHRENHPARAASRRHAQGVHIVTGTETLRLPAEREFASELAALAKADTRNRPPNWALSPWAVATYVIGGTLDDGTVISPKYVGNRRLIEIAVATLATDRALLLPGVPGTAKSWVSEHIAAAISGDSTLLVQGTAGTPEEAIRYGWNYALLLAKGPSLEAVVPSPVMKGMTTGKIVRIEELTRVPGDVQDTLITILSEKTLPVPELGSEVRAVKGFNVIATANDRDRGVNELSSALRRRFNTVVLPVPDSMEAEVDIVQRRVVQLGRSLELPIETPAIDEIRRVVTVFRELRDGKTADGKSKLKQPSSTLSTAEAISVITSGIALAAHFGAGKLQAADVASGMLGAIVKDPVQDRIVMQEYLETVVKEREGWKDLYRACKEVL